MESSLLLIPFLILIPIYGIRIYLLQSMLDSLIANDLPQNLVFKLNRLRSINIQWYIWLLRDIKDRVLIGVLGGASVGLLANLVPLLVPWGMVVLALFLLAGTCITAVILLYSAGYKVHKRVICLAVRLSIPDYVPANRKRAGCWGIAFILAGAAGLTTWYYTGSVGSVLWSFINITLGFFSLLRAFFPTAVETLEVDISAQNFNRT